MSEETVESAELGEKIVGVLKTIYDPEISVDIYELGLIYDVFVNEDADVKILMTLTTPNCPVAETLPREVEEKVKSLDEVKGAEVEITSTTPSLRATARALLADLRRLQDVSLAISFAVEGVSADAAHH